MFDIEYLSFICNSFAKKASIKEDLAKRIMYSVLPAVQSPLERHFSNDYVQLKAAVSGAKDIIQFGTMACIKELAHYKSVRSPVGMAQTYLHRKDFKTALEVCEEAFSNSKQWDGGFGGAVWKDIAKSLININQVNKALNENRTIKPRTTEVLDQEVAIMKELVVQLNIFDGLVHNTAGILPDLLDQENIYHTQLKETSGNTQENVQKEYEELLALMDAKELSNPFDVYKEVAKYIEQPNNIAPFRDYITKLRSHTDFNKPSEHIETEKATIRTRKTMKTKMSQLNRAFKELIASKDQLLNSQDNQLNYSYNIFISRVGGIENILLFICDAVYATSKNSPNSDLDLLDNELRFAAHQCQKFASNITRAIMKDYDANLTNENPYPIIIKPRINDIVSFTHQLKRAITKINNIVETIF